MGIDIQKFRAIVQHHGLKMEELTSFYAVRAGSRSVYLSKREKCGRVDLSGFRIDHLAVKDVPSEVAVKRKLGRVQAQLDFSREERQVLEAFAITIEYMKALAAAEQAALAQVHQPRNVRAAIPIERIEKGAAKQVKAVERPKGKHVERRQRT